MKKQQFYDELVRDLSSLIAGENRFITILSNSSALLFERLEGVNWAGFYLLEGDTLFLGPFQGHVACVRIPAGKGVCGHAVSENRVQRVGDVHAFPGHIACDAASNAEIVLPLQVGGQLVGVLDIDSIIYQRFDAADEEGLKALVAVLCTQLEQSDISNFINSLMLGHG
ncbi:GAF domain-containing protein [Pectobacteriaceae bacterium CE70]|uniref:Free methionine-R-sulfoxide reductase n=1 Tax=Serratia sp. (strain ATCC 39006) TaxID=104623 RepID=A0A2I5TDD5_SERS3|nr:MULTISPECIES: GAF domain-containing protein [Enterobacterales]WJV64406.1 GAF domain-containing protein [Pectobacteriaceae bacterium C52]WJV65161.1 GAF domain-containing protein [Pectobacteriaceae bacterium CE70]WJY09176.1 GAF domain-containing protein [Pectobacteriaceae bacterium C80]WJY13226.1 GAF domain-containing protein [Pectobacteriaceae bacterium CE90]AUH02545.1 Free methionine-R-sulfoxide reductase [Serratia sp. ATCC 39006]